MLFILWLLLLISSLLTARSQTQTCESTYPYSLDVGFYCAADTNGVIEFTKSCPDSLSRGFLLDNPNIILVFHGLQPGMVINSERFAQSEEFQPIVRLWLTLGYTFCVFQWTQYADDDLENFLRPESWIYQPITYTDIEYKFINNNTGFLDMKDDERRMSITEIALEHWRFHEHALIKRRGAILKPEDINLRFAGHSLGTQLSTSVAYAILRDETFIKKVNSLTLIDPVYSPEDKTYLLGNDCGVLSISELFGCRVKRLVQSNTAVQTFKTSNANSCLHPDEHYPPLAKESLFIRVYLDQFGNTTVSHCVKSSFFSSIKSLKEQIKDIAHQMYYQHVYGVPYVMLTVVSTPKICTPTADLQDCIPTDTPAVGFRIPDKQILYLDTSDLCMKQFRYQQSTYNFDPMDDYYYYVPCQDMNA